MFKRILMNQVDASPGNSAGAAPADVPAVDVQPQAQGAGAIAMTQEAFDAALASAVDKGFAKARDSFHAEARRASTAPKTKTKGDEAPPVTAALDPLKLRSLDRALAKTGLASRLSDSQYQRAEKAFAAEDPENVDAWVGDYFDGFNAAAPIATPAPQANQAAPKLPTNASPASDRGSPPPSQVPLHEADLVSMSDSDRAHLLKEKGPVWYRAQLAKQLKGRRLTM